MTDAGGETRVSDSPRPRQTSDMPRQTHHASCGTLFEERVPCDAAPAFEREEQIALPPLGLLAPLSRGEASPEMREVLPMTDSLRAELPRMLEEHVAIHAATTRLGEVARAEGDGEVAQLAEKLALHARFEEEMFYPAAVLVGDLVRARLGGR
jgi:hypothetical protein